MQGAGAQGSRIELNSRCPIGTWAPPCFLFLFWSGGQLTSAPVPVGRGFGSAPPVAPPLSPPPCCVTCARPAPLPALPVSSSFATPLGSGSWLVPSPAPFSPNRSKGISGFSLIFSTAWLATSTTLRRDEQRGAAFPFTGCVELIPKNLATLDTFFCSFAWGGQPLDQESKESFSPKWKLQLGQLCALRQRCKGASHYGLTKEQKRRSQDCSPDHGSSLAVAALGPELSAAAAIALMTDEPGLVNPAFSPTSEDSQLGSSSGDLHRTNRNRTRHFERSTIRSRSFKKINKAFSVLRRTKSGSAVSNQTDRERETVGNSAAGEEGFPRLYHLIPDGEITCIKISRTDPHENLAIRIVGGSETPLVHIIIQHIYQDGVIARDGRLLPGDMILKVNGMDIKNVPHNYALSILKQPCHVLRLTVLREQRYRCRNSGLSLDAHCNRDDSFHVVLNKSSPDEQLGIKLVRKADEPGVFIFNLLEGGMAARDGQLQENDRVLAINGHDHRYGSPESAAQLIQASEKQVHFVVSRQTRQQTPDLLQETGWSYSAGSSQPCPAERNNPGKSTLHTVTCHEKVVAVRKDLTESLGMTVAGGASNREWDLPIYVISVEPGGVISRDSRIKTGDILLNVNGIDLTGVSRSEAVALLKNTNSSVVLKALEMRACEAQEEQGHPPPPEDTEVTSESREWSPSWVMWLGLPRYLYSCKEIVLRRNTSGSLGFSIVGGYEEHTGNKPFFIKSIVGGTPAYNDGRIRCGDILLAVNGRNTSGMMHACLARMLKELKGKITLTIVSWPGTFL